MLGGYPRYSGYGRPRRTKAAHSRHHNDLVHRGFGSTRDNIDDPYDLYSELHHSPSRIPSKKDLIHLQDRTASPSSPASYVTIEQALAAAVNLIRCSPAPGVALVKASCAVDQTKWPFLFFNELDKIFFCSKLKGNVCLELSAKLPWGIPGRTSQAGVRSPRITIELSVNLIAKATETGVLTVLLHQMIHAYLLQCCDYTTEIVGNHGYDLSHGSAFLVLKNMIDMRLSQSPSSWNPLYSATSSGRAGGPPIYPEFRPGSSFCCTGDDPLSRDDINDLLIYADSLSSSSTGKPSISCPNEEKASIQYGSQASKRCEAFNFLCYNLVAGLTVLISSDAKIFSAIRRDESEASAAPTKFYNMKLEDYIELHYEKRILPLERSYINNLQDLSKSPFFTNKRELHFPDSIFAWPEFRSLYHFLVYPDFEPTLASIHANTLSKEYKAGPPVILPRKDGKQQYLSTSIAAAQLGSELKFKPLTTQAIHRLNNLGWTTNNPIKALTQIYHGSFSPNSDLRSWVKTWLAVKTPASSSDAAYAKTYPTNLALLQNHPDYKGEFAALKEKEKDKKKEFNADVEAAEKSITEAAVKAATEAAVKAAADTAAKAASNASYPAHTPHSWDPQHQYYHGTSTYSGMNPNPNATSKPAGGGPFVPDPMTGHPGYGTYANGNYGTLANGGTGGPCACDRCTSSGH